MTDAGPLSPRRKLARDREMSTVKPIHSVSSPVPYLVVFMLLAMIIMIFVDVMPIAALICLFSFLMVLVIVLGNHWKNAITWEQENEYDFYFQPHYHSTTNNLERENPSAALLRPCEKCNHLKIGDSSHHSIRSSRSRNNRSSNHSRQSSFQSENFSDLERITKEGMYFEALPLEAPNDCNNGEIQHDKLGPMTKEDKIDNLNEFFDALFMSIDYSLLLIFLGLFIVVENMASTGLPKYIW